MLYEIGDFGMIASPIFVIIGIYMAHTLYKSPRKRWQCVLAWVSINLVCIPPSEILTALLPQVTEQRIGIFLGCSFVLVYLYLFPNIPLPQRIFT